MPKRPPGVYKRGKTWSVVIDHGRDPVTGKCKRVWHSGFKTLSEAAEHVLPAADEQAASTLARVILGDQPMAWTGPGRNRPSADPHPVHTAGGVRCKAYARPAGHNQRLARIPFEGRS